VRRLLFLSYIAAPHQIGFCRAMRRHYDAEFWFYERLSPERASWWKVEPGEHCKVLEPVHFRSGSVLANRYYAPGLERELERFDPDIVMLGGFSVPSNWLAYRWAKARGKKTVVFTERSRDRDGTLRRRGLAWRLLRYLYRDVDLVVTSAGDAVPQYRDEFRFGDKVVEGRYAADLDAYFSHPLREAKPAYTFLFANRMTPIYDPLLAVEIFARVLSRHPGSRLLVNEVGELGPECRRRIAELGIGDAVAFLTGIRSWDELDKVYEGSDILLLPARFSNGNFTILEAMASGMGIVVSDRVLGIGKLIEDGKNGFNCEPTVEAFCDRIERYLARPALFAEHAARNRPIAEPFSAEGTARFFHELFERRLGA
jgi:glycosyltransferase involved in cell wall biosynthesis